VTTGQVGLVGLGLDRSGNDSRLSLDKCFPYLPHLAHLPHPAHSATATGFLR